MQVARTVVVLLAFVVATPARADEERVPEIMSRCHGPSSWADLSKCVDDTHEGYKLPARPSSKIAFAANERHDRYLFFQRSDGKWAYASRFYDENFLIDEPRPIRMGHGDGIWIDIHRVDRRGTDLVLHRSALICSSLGSCSLYQYECTHMVGGRSVETFRGTIEIDADGTIQLLGDRSQAGGRC